MCRMFLLSSACMCEPYFHGTLAFENHYRKAIAAGTDVGTALQFISRIRKDKAGAQLVSAEIVIKHIVTSRVVNARIKASNFSWKTLLNNEWEIHACTFPWHSEAAQRNGHECVHRGNNGHECINEWSWMYQWMVMNVSMNNGHECINEQWSWMYQWTMVMYVSMNNGHECINEQWSWMHNRSRKKSAEKIITICY